MRTSLKLAGRCSTLAVVGLLLLSPDLAGELFAQGPRSAAVAKELALALDQAKLDAIAAPDPSDPSSFVAALYFPQSQLLAVAAKYAAPSLLLEKIKQKNYRDVYIDLSSASIAGSKMFVIDTGVDGVSARPGDSGADSWEHGAKNYAFDGEWKKAKLSEGDYTKAYEQADEQYAKMLSALLAQLKKS
jgi:hypothetical protein